PRHRLEDISKPLPKTTNGKQKIMTMKYPVGLIFSLAIFFVMRDTPECLNACCPAFREGAGFRIADQRILIAWDPQSKIEHFVREAAFRGSANDDSDFGFLVPSPTQPQIEESDASVFSALNQKIQPRVEFKDRWSVDPFPLVLSPFVLMETKVGSGLSTDSAIAPALAVLENKKVAGYEVAVLKANDANELIQWLKDNQYQARKDLEEWVVPYIEKGWVITAFKYDSSSKRTQVGTVRISFATENPVFPYRVPKDQFIEGGKGNLLQVFVVGPGRASGSLGQSPSNEAWMRGNLRFSMPVAPAEIEELIGAAVPRDQIKTDEPLWLTAWDDRTWPSSDKDLWFGFDPNGEVYQKVRTVTQERSIYLPIDVLGLATLGTGLRVRRRRAQNGSNGPSAIG
ncbi:MAG: DUF2330 domain-containing protein, partial [Planctomycetota bacterium]